MTARCQVNTPIVWTDDRCVELDALSELLREVSAINHGSNCLERILRCIDLAEKLSRDAISENRDSLLTFLRGLAIAERLRATCNDEDSP